MGYYLVVDLRPDDLWSNDLRSCFATRRTPDTDSEPVHGLVVLVEDPAGQA